MTQVGANVGDRVGVILVGGFEGDAQPQSTLSHFSHIVCECVRLWWCENVPISTHLWIMSRPKKAWVG